MAHERVLSTSAERRAEIEVAAVEAFSSRGFYGTTTNEVAAGAGVSQAYLYKLYPDKTALFVAALDHASDRLARMVAAALDEHAGEEDTAQMLRHATSRLMSDQAVARLLMHAAAAANEPEIGVGIRRCYDKQVAVLLAHSAATPSEIRRYFADGMLATVLHAIGVRASEARWAEILLGP